MSIRIWTNIAECAEHTTKLPEFATESLDLGQIWIRIIVDFSPVCMVVQELFLAYLAYSPVFCSVFGWRFGWILGAIRVIRADSALFVLFGSIWLDDSGLPQLTIRISPNLPRMPRTPPRIRSNSIRIYPRYGSN